MVHGSRKLECLEQLRLRHGIYPDSVIIVADYVSQNGEY